MRQLDLVFKIRYGAQTPHHYGGVLLLGKVDCQAVKAHHLDIGDILAAFPQHLFPFLHGKQRGFGAVV